MNVGGRPIQEMVGMLPDEMEQFISSLGERPFRARQIAKWIYKKGVTDLEQMTDLSGPFRLLLSHHACLTLPSVREMTSAADGTVKFLLGLSDGAFVESVIIPEEERTTLCVSSQAGCALNCAFCVTGGLGLTRNLTSGEIVGQVLVAQNHLRERGGALTNIVFMGMGEPLLNYEQVSRALAIILSDWGLSFSWRHVTVSTAGIPEGIARLGRDVLVNLAVSLNAPDDPTRDRIMPVNRKYPLDVLMAALRAYPLKRGRRITLEYVLLKGINDTDDHARALVGLVNGIPVKINLIPFNAFTDAPFLRPDDSRVLAFQEILIYAHLNAIIRKSKGGEIAAACGQLAAGCTAGRPKLSRTKKRGRSDGAA
jgi:23S rRNA (adenine2503-C2)-methyltransferase